MGLLLFPRRWRGIHKSSPAAGAGAHLQTRSGVTASETKSLRDRLGAGLGTGLRCTSRSSSSRTTFDINRPSRAHFNLNARCSSFDIATGKRLFGSILRNVTLLLRLVFCQHPKKRMHVNRGLATPPARCAAIGQNSECSETSRFVAASLKFLF